MGIDPTPIFGGDQIAAARPGTDQMGQPTVDIELKAEGADMFDEYAAAHYGERFAIVLDGLVISAPTINATSFDGSAQISGSFTTDEVNRLVTLVKFGRLPLAVEEVSVDDPGPPPDATPAGSRRSASTTRGLPPMRPPWRPGDSGRQPLADPGGDHRAAHGRRRRIPDDGTGRRGGVGRADQARGARRPGCLGALDPGRPVAHRRRGRGVGGA